MSQIKLEPIDAKAADTQLLMLAGEIAEFVRSKSASYCLAREAMEIASTLLLENPSSLWKPRD